MVPKAQKYDGIIVLWSRMFSLLVGEDGGVDGDNNVLFFYRVLLISFVFLSG